MGRPPLAGVDGHGAGHHRHVEQAGPAAGDGRFGAAPPVLTCLLRMLRRRRVEGQGGGRRRRRRLRREGGAPVAPSLDEWVVLVVVRRVGRRRVFRLGPLRRWARAHAGLAGPVVVQAVVAASGAADVQGDDGGVVGPGVEPVEVGLVLGQWGEKRLVFGPLKNNLSLFYLNHV